MFRLAVGNLILIDWKKIQIETAHIVIGLLFYASLNGMGKLDVRRKVMKLTVFYKIVTNCNLSRPDYLHDLASPSVSDTNNYRIWYLTPLSFSFFISGIYLLKYNE